MADYDQQNQYQHFATPDQTQYQQQQYPQQYQSAPAADQTVSIGNWIGTLILMCIPLVNLIMLFVWAFSSNSKPSKANWAKANLILVLIAIVISIITVIIMVATGVTISNLPTIQTA